METSNDIIEACGGRATVQDALGLTEAAVRMGIKQGKLPAMWYDALERLYGGHLPRHLFTFRGGKE